MTNPAGLARADLSVPKLPVRPVRALANAALFLITCAAVCLLLGRFAPFPEVPGIFPKWEWFKKQRDEFDVLFVGSSRFFHQVIPEQFDAEVAKAGGAAVRSFNFAYDGVWPLESFYLLRQILALRPARLKWVIIELKDIDTELDERNNATLRMAYWHDARHTLMAFDDIMARPSAWVDRRELLIGHGWLFLQQVVNVGRGADLVERRLAPPRARKTPFSWESRAGYAPGPEHEIAPDELPGYREKLERMKTLGPPEPLRPVFHDALREVIAEVRRVGAEPIFVIAPTVNPVENFTGVPDGAPQWSYNNPTEFPALYDPAHHYDSWHLNPKGAVEFTALLAARFAEFTSRAR